MKLKNKILTAMILGVSSMNSQNTYGKVVTLKQFDKLSKDTNLTITRKHPKSKNEYPYREYYIVFNKTTKLSDTILFKIGDKPNCPSCGKG